MAGRNLSDLLDNHQRTYLLQENQSKEHSRNQRGQIWSRNLRRQEERKLGQIVMKNVNEKIHKSQDELLWNFSLIRKDENFPWRIVMKLLASQLWYHVNGENFRFKSQVSPLYLIIDYHYCHFTFTPIYFV